jgi:hypothetical protein
LDNFYQNKWIRSCFCDSYYSNDSQLSFHDTRDIKPDETSQKNQFKNWKKLQCDFK